MLTSNWLRVLSGISVLAALALLGNAITIPLLRGAALAQADLELFIWTVFLGPVILIISVPILWRLRRHTTEQTRVRGNSSLVIANIASIVLLLIVICFLVVLKQFRFFWL